jgi:peptidoglycan hydrolase-like protein with peptidoglycan-binding domain
MKKLLLVLPILCLPVFSATPTQAAAKKPAAKSVAAKTTSKTSAAKTAKTKKPATKTVKSAKSKSKSKKASVTPARTVQQHPTSERYTEIQQALVERGYMTEANGSWDAASVAAMKKFQEDQALHADGKLSALSLTALGLGPRRGAFVVAPTPVVATSTTPTAVE